MSVSLTAIPPFGLDNKLQPNTKPISLKSRVSSCLNIITNNIFSFASGMALQSLGNRIAPLFGHNNQCPNLPQFVYALAEKSSHIWNYIPCNESPFIKVAIMAPIVEESIFRLGIQEIGLREIPKIILNRFAPSYANAVDAKIIQLARVVFTALSFSLVHALPENQIYSTAYLVEVFTMGLILSTVQEITQSPLLVMLIHSGFNLKSALYREFEQREY
jgi:membrane protease YdiL (CAAX protease family)